jgi:hypothetical protein
VTTIDPPLSAALSTDYFFLREQLTEEQLGVLRTTRAFVDDEVLPSINTYCERAELPWPLIRRIGEQQFGKPLASFQLIHDRLVKMLAEVTGMQLYCLQVGRARAPHRHDRGPREAQQHAQGAPGDRRRARHAGEIGAGQGAGTPH